MKQIELDCERDTYIFLKINNEDHNDNEIVYNGNSVTLKILIASALITDIDFRNMITDAISMAISYNDEDNGE